MNSIQTRIFDPFLSISYQIIAQKHGDQKHGDQMIRLGDRIECLSDPQQGTKFIIRIPLKQSAAQRDAKAMPPAAIYR
jgi:hypothetical protein